MDIVAHGPRTARRDAAAGVVTRRLLVRLVLPALVLALVAAAARGEARQDGPPVIYRVTFDGAAHHWIEVEATFGGLGSEPLRARMSRSSPGRYATHEFAKNVFSFSAFDGAARPLSVQRSHPDEWIVSGHDGTVRVVYRLFGDHADGTYMGVDTTHAHLNMPATFLWAVGLEDRAIHVTFVPPGGSGWRVGTQLFPIESSPYAFTAPNLQYFMDSPTELADWTEASFRVDDPTGRASTFRLLVHGGGSVDDVKQLATLVERVVRAHASVFGELPVFEPGHYTFLLDLVEWADGDGMEHRNSTSIVIPGLSLSSPDGRRLALSTISHEFFHVWNVERIRPADLEPFDFTHANVSCCLWLAEGFTEYYGQLLLVRAGLSDEVPVGGVAAVTNGSGRLVRSAVRMSEHAPFADAAVANDRTDRSRSYISYYTYGEALALALDLSLRGRTEGRRSLDDFMRQLWQVHGAPLDPRPGYVSRPYTLADLRAALADVAGDRLFADDFFTRYVEGRELPDFAALLAAAAYAVQPYAPGRGWIGTVAVAGAEGALRVGAGSGPPLVAFGTPLYDADVDFGDVIREIDGRPATVAAWNAISQRAPGDVVRLTVLRRDGRVVSTDVRVAADPRIIVVPIEATGRSPSAAQRAFRAAWLGR
jgi:predicted metalloprotease with PDZ domain